VLLPDGTYDYHEFEGELHSVTVGAGVGVDQFHVSPPTKVEVSYGDE
jgi:hypothetical protein